MASEDQSQVLIVAWQVCYPLTHLLSLQSGCSSFLSAIAFLVWTVGPRESSLALTAYECPGQCKIHFCEPECGNGPGSLCSLKNNFNSWFVHLMFLGDGKMHKGKHMIWSENESDESSRSTVQSPRNGAREKLVHAVHDFPSQAPSKEISVTIWKALLSAPRDAFGRPM